MLNKEYLVKVPNKAAEAEVWKDLTILVFINVLKFFMFCEEQFLIKKIIKFFRLKLSSLIVHECIDSRAEYPHFCHKDSLYVYLSFHAQ